MVADQDAAVINTSLLTNWNDLDPLLKVKPWNSVNGVVYGVPHGWGANLLMYNKNVVKPAPDFVGRGVRRQLAVQGQDHRLRLADLHRRRRLYLMKTKPDLGIKDPYALDDTQFKAVVDLMKVQRPLIGEYWSDYLKEQDAFIKGSLVLGTTWQITTNGVQADKTAPPVDAIIPKEGSTAWSDSWMINAKAKHPNCAYMSGSTGSRSPTSRRRWPNTSVRRPPT